jgi:hypothetical protein
MFGELRNNIQPLKDALAVNLAFTFGFEMKELVGFHWEFLIFGDIV